MRWDGTSMPLIEPGDDFAACAEFLAVEFHEEFAAYPFIDPDAVEAAALASFMPMATRFMTPDGERSFLTPKLHLERCVLDPARARVTRTARRESSRYGISVNRAFGPVIEACVAVHGDDWLVPDLVDAFKRLHAQRESRTASFLSFELWIDRGNAVELAAGEFGYLIGSAYASLSGFSRVSGAGTVQLAGTGGMLASAGVEVWDLGMPIEYKAAMGGLALPRSIFLPLLAKSYGRASSMTRAKLVTASEIEPARYAIGTRPKAL